MNNMGWSYAPGKQAATRRVFDNDGKELGEFTAERVWKAIELCHDARHRERQLSRSQGGGMSL